MNPRKNIRKRRATESDDEEDLTTLQQPSDKRAKPAGISATALMKGDTGGSIKWSNAKAIAAKAGFQANAAVKRQELVLQSQMEEFIQQGLDKEFKTAAEEEADAEALDAGPSLEEELHAIPESMEGTATLDVVIPGFNTAITEYKLGAEAQLRSIEAAEAAKKALYGQSSQTWQPVSIAKKGKPRQEHAIPRGAFPKSFGKQKPKEAGMDAPHVKRR